MARMKCNMTAITVEGCGSFPTDMLRYDACVPDGQEDVNKIDGGYAEWGRGSRQVNLRMYTPVGGREGATVARWESFGWRVIKQVKS